MKLKNYNGVLLVCKPPGLSSHAVIRVCRQRLGTREIGHAGTLDPAAAGLLVLCLGRSTRLSEYLMDGEKEYIAEAGFGIATDTYDAEGRIVSRRQVEKLDRKQIEDALVTLRGEQMQYPPPYSAIKQKGVPAYRRARRGEKVSLSARPVVIRQLQLLSDPTIDERNGMSIVRLRIVCSKGTYIRSIVHDLGQALGCGAYLRFLIRVRSGMFDVAEASLLEEIGDGDMGPGWLEPAQALRHLPAIRLDEETAIAVENGKQGVLAQLESEITAAVDDCVRDRVVGDVPLQQPHQISLHDEQGQLIAVACRQEAEWRLDKVFPRSAS